MVLQPSDPLEMLFPLHQSSKVKNPSLSYLLLLKDVSQLKPAYGGVINTVTQGSVLGYGSALNKV